MRETGAIVLGSDFQTTDLVESLGRHDIKVAVLSAGFLPATYSRFNSLSLREPEFALNFKDLDQQKEALLNIGSRCGLEGWVVMPTHDRHVEFLAEYYEELSEMYRLASPASGIADIGLDKGRTRLVANKLGIPYPKTKLLSGSDKLSELELGFPVVVKPLTSHRFIQRAGAKAFRVNDYQELEDCYRRVFQYVDPDEVMIQEYIDTQAGGRYSYAGAYVNGESQAFLVGQRVRQFPPDFGWSSTCVRTIQNELVRELGDRFLSGIQYTGIAEVEFMKNDRGDYLLHDFNMRPWAWHSLGRQAGVDFGFLMYQIAAGEKLEPAEAIQDVYWIREIDDFYSQIVSKRPAVDIAREYMKLSKKTIKLQTFNFNDPVPTALEIGLRLRDNFQKVFKTKVSGR